MHLGGVGLVGGGAGVGSGRLLLTGGEGYWRRSAPDAASARRRAFHQRIGRLAPAEAQLA